MKLRLPEFNLDFNNFDINKPLEELLRDKEFSFNESSDFPFYSMITIDIDDGKDLYVYGFISKSRWYADSIVATDYFYVKNTKQLINAYKKVEKQLCARYRVWVKENLYKK